MDLKLTLFFSRGISLQQWDAQGLLAREVALYHRLQEYGVRVTFVTYGDSRDKDYTKQLSGIKILCNQWNLSTKRYMQRLQWIHAPSLLRTHIIKTNQMLGADIALRTAQLWRKPLIVRCGYLYSLSTLRRTGSDTAEYHESLKLESQVFPAAQQIILTTRSMIQDVTERLPQVTDRTNLIPNYVDTDLFVHRETPVTDKVDIVYVGRLSEEKNLPLLLEAVRQLPGVTLRIIGKGDLLETLQQDFHDLKERVIWQGAVSNAQLPDYLAAAKVFVLPSRYEQLPKALLEAMSCSMAVIGTRVPGIQEVIQHERTGYLCDVSAEGLKNAIQTLLENDELRYQTGLAARTHIIENFSLDSIVRAEIELLKNMVQ